MPKSKPLTTTLPLTPAHENAKKFIAGLTAFQHGQLVQAKSILEDLLNDEPNYFDALHLCGIVLRQLQETKRSIAFLEKALVINSDHADLHSNLGNALTDDAQYEQAVTHCNMAIRLNPRHTNAHSNRAIALQRLGKLDEALLSYQKAIAIKPGNHVHYLNQGIIHLKRHSFDEALKSFEAAIHIKPDFAEAHFNRGNALTELKQLEAAVASYDKAISVQPDYAEAHVNRGVALKGLQQLQAAVASYDKAIAIKPDFAEAYANRGVALQHLGQLDAALASCEKAIAMQPNNAQAHANCGLVLQALKKPEAALACYDTAISLQPCYAEAYFNRGNALTELKQLEAAVASYDKAISLKSEYADAYANRGVALTNLRQMQAALDSFEKAIAIKRNFAEAHSNRGMVLNELKRLDEALLSYDKAISIKPDYADGYWNKSLALLLCGNFDEGWRLYEWRWKHESLGFKLPNFSQPLWLGVESLKGRTILLHSEQGFGDTIQFCRYAKQVKALGARVVMQVPRALLTLVQSLDGVDELVAKGQALPAFDYHCPLMSLPLAFKTKLSTVPSPEPYLRSDSAKVAQWHARLGPKTKPRIGLVWSGSTGHKNDHNRSLKLDELAPYLPQGLAYVCLQNEIREVDKQALQQSTIQHFSDELKDFADTAALCELMDVVISVDTSVAHLSGALGKPTWVLLPHNSDWRWLLDREDSPWYDSVRLFRQDKSWSWSTVLQKVTKALLESRPTHISSERRS